MVNSITIDESKSWFDPDEYTYFTNLYGHGEAKAVLDCSFCYEDEVIDGTIIVPLELFHSYDDNYDPSEPDIATCGLVQYEKFLNDVYSFVKSHKFNGGWEQDREKIMNLTDSYISLHELFRNDQYLICDVIYEAFPMFDLKPIPDDADYDYESEQYDRERAWDEQEYQIGKSLAEQGIDEEY
jgi:hypothetical protein